MKSGLETVPGLEENLRFTSYSLDPVIGKYFAQARFYDSRCGRMLSPDPVKRGLNSYHYCNDDPVNYEDSTGEIANILIGGALGAITGGAFGSSVGLPAALAADFVAGTVGSRGQGYNGGYAGALLGRAGSFSPYTYGRDPRSSCGGSRQTGKSLCYTTSRGYQYGATQTKETKSGKKYSLKGFIKETLSGGVMGGLTGAAFYGGDKSVDKIKRSIFYGDSDRLGIIIGKSRGDELERAYKIAGPNTPEQFNVIAHGNPKGIMFEGWLLNAEEAAMLIRHSPQYVGGKQRIKIYSCSTGQQKGGFAQQFANILQTEVEAPNTTLFVTKLGGFTVAEKVGNVYIRGEWIIFRPRQ